MFMKIGVVGSGSWGTALAHLLNQNGHTVTLWGNKKDDIIQMQKTRENKNFLPGIKLDEGLK
ncbi:MAG: glycerol-3-phosphate dehydrogenase, partial [Eubacteriales bacterium]|nr:glycerol-3-phosphate dehydrogenase [Eubacteriales bacterium]